MPPTPTPVPAAAPAPPAAPENWGMEHLIEALPDYGTFYPRLTDWIHRKLKHEEFGFYLSHRMNEERHNYWKKKISEADNPAGYLYGILRNEKSSFFRRQARQKARLLEQAQRARRGEGFQSTLLELSDPAAGLNLMLEKLYSELKIKDRVVLKLRLVCLMEPGDAHAVTHQLSEEEGKWSPQPRGRTARGACQILLDLKARNGGKALGFGAVANAFGVNRNTADQWWTLAARKCRRLASANDMEDFGCCHAA